MRRALSALTSHTLALEYPLPNLAPQPFPFEGCPPTKRGPCHSPGLARLTGAISARIGGMSSPERNGLVRGAATACAPGPLARARRRRRRRRRRYCPSYHARLPATIPFPPCQVRIVLNLCAAFSSFQRWSVGLGVEHQLNALRAAVGLPEVPVSAGAGGLRVLGAAAGVPAPAGGWGTAPTQQLRPLNSPQLLPGLPCMLQLLPGRLNLDYDALVQPRRCEQTLMEVFSNPEDFFFRTIHLGTGEGWCTAKMGAKDATMQERCKPALLLLPLPSTLPTFCPPPPRRLLGQHRPVAAAQRAGAGGGGQLAQCGGARLAGGHRAPPTEASPCCRRAQPLPAAGTSN